MSDTDWVMYRGDDRSWQITVGGASPVDLTGAHLRWTAKLSESDAAPAIELTSDPGGGIVIAPDPTTGVCTITIPASSTDGLSRQTRYVWDLQITDAAGNVRTLPDPDVARSTLGTLLVRLDLSRTAP